ncbi:MAG: sugar transferase [Planctomycetaceae bacterium]|nr:sugar transferase [Planctomycetaceae bacterium]
MNSSTVYAEKLSAGPNQHYSEEKLDSDVSASAFLQTAVVVANPRFFAMKNHFDRAAGIGLLVLTAPLTLVLCGVVKLASKGPGFYRQKRVGLNGKEFDIVKLRTMIVDSEPAGQAVWCVKRDPRITPLGRILRKTHLDELPQLWNVAKGEMSLVGPRPERPEICETLAKRVEGYYDRNTVKPGVTGLAQINLPPDESFEDVQRKQILDLRYIEEANFWLEARILLATAFRMFGLRGSTVMKMMRLSRNELLSNGVAAAGDSEDQPSFAYGGPGRPR